MLYFAYGANLNLRGMKRRCPQAVPVSAATLQGYRLEFRNFLTIVADPNSTALGALYKLTPQCWRSLDEFEGRDYSKISVTVNTTDGLQEATAYIMEKGTRAPPTVAYFTDIARGYADWKYDVNVLRRARYALLHPERRAKTPNEKLNRGDAASELGRGEERHGGKPAGGRQQR